MLDTELVEETIEITVLVQFQTSKGTVKQGDFVAVCKRQPVEKTDEMLDDDWMPSAICKEILIGAKKIGRGGVELSPEEGRDWVLQTPECVNATVAAFFKTTRPERYNEKTSRKRR